MNLEYLIVGITKDSKEDFLELYKAMRVSIYAVALATVKDKALAREIAVETFRRLKTYAYTFDTELNAEYWILDMVRQLSLNALKDNTLRAAVSENGIADNASALILKTLSQLKNERGFLLTLQAVTSLSGKDIATLSGFYRGSAMQEARRGLLELRASYPKVSKKELNQALREDFKEACPDYLEYIELERSTKVAHISHEAMYLEDEEIIFQGEAESESIQARTEAAQVLRNRRIKIALIVLTCLVLLSSGTAIVYRLMKDAKSTKEPERVQTAASMEMLEIDGVLYYRDADTGIYAYDPSSQDAQPKLIYDEPVRDLITTGTMLVFRNYKDGKMYRIDLNGEGLIQMTDHSGTSLVFNSVSENGSVYFNASDGIYKFPVSYGETAPQHPEAEVVYKEEVEDAPTRFHMAFAEDGTLIFSAGADGGIYRVVDGDLQVLYLDEAYYFQIEDNLLFFDAIGLKDMRYLYAIDLNQEDKTDSKESAFPTIQLHSAAYYVVGDTVYYEGFNEAGKENGLYSLNLTNGTRTLIEKIGDDQLHITDMYASSSKLYCYYSDGTGDGENTLIARPLDNLDKTETIF